MPVPALDSPLPDAAAAAPLPASPEPAQPLPPGYNPGVEQLRREEFTRFAGKVYCDYGGSAPYSEALLRASCAQLCSDIYGNPHSGEDAASVAAERARRLTLAMCNASEDEYVCIFTAGATAALKLVAESFPWADGDRGVSEGCGPAADAQPDPSRRYVRRASSLHRGEEVLLASEVARKLAVGQGQGIYLYLRDDHNSVLGIRQVASEHGAEAVAAVEFAPVSSDSDSAADGGPAFALRICTGEAAADIVAAAALKAARERRAQKSGMMPPSEAEQEQQHLLAYPLESNFSGAKYSLELINALREGRVVLQQAPEDGEGADMPMPAGRWRVLLDCAKGAATSPPDLSAFPADFAAISYYKLFGYPTGLGALIARKEAFTNCLRKRWFAGGTVVAVSAEDPFFVLKTGVEAWEDGSLHFMAPPTICLGFKFAARLGGFPAISAHACAVAEHLAAQLAALRHANGAPAVVLYRERPGTPGVVGQGPVVTFNLKRPDGSWVPTVEVEHAAHARGIHLRIGCACNPGACSKFCGFTLDDIKSALAAGHECRAGTVWKGIPFGGVRCTFGFHSSLSDADTVAAMVRECFVARPGEPAAGGGASAHAVCCGSGGLHE